MLYRAIPKNYLEGMSFARDMQNLRAKIYLMPQGDMAHYLGVKNRMLISQWERGVRTPTEPIQRLVRVLLKMPAHEAKQFLIDMSRAASK